MQNAKLPWSSAAGAWLIIQETEECNQARIWEEGREILHSGLCFTTAWLDLVSQLSSHQLCKVAGAAISERRAFGLIAAVLRDLSLFQWELGIKMPSKVWQVAVSGTCYQIGVRAGLRLLYTPCMLQQLDHLLLSVHLPWCGPQSGLTLFLYAVQLTPLFPFQCQELPGDVWLTNGCFFLGSPPQILRAVFSLSLYDDDKWWLCQMQKDGGFDV